MKQRLIEVIKILIDNPGLKPYALSEKLKESEVTIKRDVRKIKALVIFKGGQAKGGYYLTHKALERIKQ